MSMCINTADDGTCDRAIDPTNQNQYIVWGIGALGETAFQHHTRATGTCTCRYMYTRVDKRYHLLAMCVYNIKIVL